MENRNAPNITQFGAVAQNRDRSGLTGELFPQAAPAQYSSPDQQSPRSYIVPYKLFISSLVPQWLERMPIPAGAKLCYARLVRFDRQHTGIAEVKQDELAAAIGVSDKTVRKYLDRLETKGLIEITRRGQGRPSQYRFLAHPAIDSFLNRASDSDRNTSSVQERNPYSDQDRNACSAPSYKKENQEREGGRVLFLPTWRKNREQQRAEPAGFSSIREWDRLKIGRDNTS
jgi:DNA-binding transcriptional ArsR family regulator